MNRPSHLYFRNADSRIEKHRSYHTVVATIDVATLTRTLMKTRYRVHAPWHVRQRQALRDEATDCDFASGEYIGYLHDHRRRQKNPPHPYNNRL
jgi:hypothetical protein